MDALADNIGTNQRTCDLVSLLTLKPARTYNGALKCEPGENALINGVS